MQSEEVPEQKEKLKKAEDFWKDEKRARSGRRREHPEALTIPSVKEDPFDHKESKVSTETLLKTKKESRRFKKSVHNYMKCYTFLCILINQVL